MESNHYHMVVTDLEGRLSEFVQELNGCAARCLIEYYRQRVPTQRLDCVWSGAESFCGTLLVNAAALLDKLVYTYVNPVKDGLVADYRKWPGFNTRPSDWHKGKRTVKRPDYFFKHTPDKLTYKLVPPRQLQSSQRGVDAVVADVELHIRDAQVQAATDMAAQGRSFVGAKAILRTDPFDSPNTQRPRGQLTPHLAAGGDTKAMKTAATALRTFRLAYREAWMLFKDGLDVMFPGGTLLMRKRFGMECDPLDACWCELATASG